MGNVTKKEAMTTLSIRISQEEKDLLQEIADENCLSVSQLVRRAIRDFIL